MSIEQLGGLSEQAALREILRRRINAEHWRGARRRASLLLALSIPLLAGLLVASFPFLTRAHVAGSRSVLSVCLLGGLLAGTLLAAPKLAEVVRTRSPREEQLADKLLLVTFVPALLSGLAGALLAASAVLAFAARDSYRPQTLYLIAFALASALSRLLRVSFVSVPGWPNG